MPRRSDAAVVGGEPREAYPGIRNDALRRSSGFERGQRTGQRIGITPPQFRFPCDARIVCRCALTVSTVAPADLGGFLAPKQPFARQPRTVKNNHFPPIVTVLVRFCKWHLHKRKNQA
jgi:hypothetical protein